MPNIEVLVRYRTNSGCNATYVKVEARDLDDAIAKACDIVSKRRGVIRIDGGEARSIPPTASINRDDAIEAFRHAVLTAMDEACDRTFGTLGVVHRNDRGATDGDLPALFPTIDAQVERLAARYGVTLIEEDLDDFNYVGSRHHY